MRTAARASPTTNRSDRPAGQRATAGSVARSDHTAVGERRPGPGYRGDAAAVKVELAKVFDEDLTATATFPRGGNVERGKEVAIGNLVADSMRLAYGTQIAFTNSGGICSSLPSAYVPLDPNVNRATAPYDVVIGDPYTILPFGNSVVTRDVTGSQLWAALENGVSRINPDGTGADGRFPQISGFRFTYDGTKAPGSRVLTVTLDDGTVVANDPGQTVTMAAPDFINVGGDGYVMFLDGIQRRVRRLRTSCVTTSTPRPR